jgi:hypothetical protein
MFYIDSCFISAAKFEPPLLPECSELDITGCSPPTIKNGQVHPNFNIYVGDSVHVTCDEEYMILGPQSSVCGSDGNFDELPICSKKPKECPAPVIENAIISPEDKNILEGKTEDTTNNSASIESNYTTKFE